MIVGLCVLFLLAHGSAAAKVVGTTKARNATRHHAPLSLQARLQHAVLAARKERSVIHFFERHRSLLRSSEHGVLARKTFVRAKRRLAVSQRRASRLRHALQVAELRKLRSAEPKTAICAVFERYCAQALDVAWCESRLDTSAQNGQYLGLFQMGSTARRLFGHGPTAFAQSVAAHRYFLHSGRDWSPWSCKPAAF